MTIKFTSKNSYITVTTFAEAPETADLDIQINDGTTVNAETMFKITTVQSIYSKLGVPADSITTEQLATLIQQVLDIRESGENLNKSSLLDWANRTAVFATIASSGPLIAAVTGIIAFASNGKEYLKNVLTVLKK